VQAIENSVVTIQRSLVAAYEKSCALKTADQGCRTPYWDSQLGKLRKAGVVLTLRSWIDAMLRCRSVRVKIRRISVRVLVNRECLQGGVLSPLLWNMVDGLLRRFHNAHYQAQGYADEVVLMQKGKFVSTLCDPM
jgi:hypothetical protein